MKLKPVLAHLDFIKITYSQNAVSVVRASFLTISNAPKDIVCVVF